MLALKDKLRQDQQDMLDTIAGDVIHKMQTRLFGWGPSAPLGSDGFGPSSSAFGAL